MSDWTANAFPVLRGELSAPLSGRWIADLEVDASEALSGAVEIRIGGVAWRGTVWRGALDDGADVWRGRIVGGSGGLDRPVTARSWLGLQPARGLLVELLTEVDESLSPSSTAEIDTNVARWSRVEGPAHRALADLASVVGARWRLTSEGTVWVGSETWPELVLPEGAEAELLSTDPMLGVSTYALPGAYISPGCIFEGRRVAGVVYDLEDAVERARVFFLDEAANVS